MQAGRAAILAYTMPMWAILLSRFVVKRHITAMRLWGIGFRFGGLFLSAVARLRAVEAAPRGRCHSWERPSVGRPARCWSSTSGAYAGDPGDGWQLLMRRHSGGLRALPAGAIIGHLPRIVERSADVDFRSFPSRSFSATRGAFFRVVQIFPANVARPEHAVHPQPRVFSSALLLGEPLRTYELVALAWWWSLWG